jgi:hypothetical protein
MAIQWKEVAKGVVSASVGAALFGAVHFMYLAPTYGTGSVMGVPMTVVLPFALGIGGFFIGTWGANKWAKGWLGDIITYGSAAVIGFGIAEYAGWITGASSARARASAYVPQRAYVPMNPQYSSAGYSGSGGGNVKII